jgi:hypothetical protein
MAILRHETPDGAAHFDLLLAETPRVPDDARVVPTWRCDRDPLALGKDQRARIEPIAPHRGFYLRLDRAHELSDARGRVHPVRRGWHAAADATTRVLCGDDGWRARVRFERGELVVLESDQVKAS